jgi:hypothetical protein
VSRRKAPKLPNTWRPFIGAIDVASVRSTDVIVITATQMLSAEAMAQIEQLAKKVWPDNHVVVLDAGFQLKVVREEKESL